MQVMPSLPKMKVLLTRSKGAPEQPDEEQIAAACLRAWALVPARRCPEASKSNCLSVDVGFIGDEEMAVKNAQYMRHEGPTDVLSFPIADLDLERGSFHLGGVLVSFDTAKREASERGISLIEELTRYCVHGFLHCLGYDDSTPAKRRAMFAIQEQAVRAHALSRKGKRES